MTKGAQAFRTIREVADWLGLATHVLRFWESKFPQIKPVKRAGGRRYYRPADMQLVGGIKVLLHDQGMTIRGVQKLIRKDGVEAVKSLSPVIEHVHDDDAPDEHDAWLHDAEEDSGAGVPAPGPDAAQPEPVASPAPAPDAPATPPSDSDDAAQPDPDPAPDGDPAPQQDPLPAPDPDADPAPDAEPAEMPLPFDQGPDTEPAPPAPAAEPAPAQSAPMPDPAAAFADRDALAPVAPALDHLAAVARDPGAVAPETRARLGAARAALAALRDRMRTDAEH